MEQANIKSIPVALIIASKAVDGGIVHETGLGITRNTAEHVEAERLALITARTTHLAAATILRERRKFRDDLLEADRAFLMFARNVLRPHLGTHYSARWTGPGFHGSLQIPNPPDKVINLLGAMSEFLKENPAMEVAGLNVTATYVRGLHDGLLAAQNAVKNSDVIVRNLQAVRDERFRGLRKRLRNLAKELSLILDSNDNRWLDFGLNIPGAKRTPPAPEKVTATPVGETALAVKWDATPRAEYYRVRVKVEGVDEESNLVGSPTDPDFTLEHVPSDKAVEVSISAVNKTGESRGSMVTIVRSGIGHTAG